MEIKSKSQLKDVIKEMVKEILQEDDLISKIILEAYKATKVISSVENSNPQPIEEKRTIVPKQTNKTNTVSEFDKWKKIIGHRPANVDASDLNLFNQNIVPIESVMSSKQVSEKKEFSSLNDLMNEPMIDASAPEKVEADTAIMNMFAKKFKK